MPQLQPTFQDTIRDCANGLQQHEQVETNLAGKYKTVGVMTWCDDMEKRPSQHIRKHSNGLINVHDHTLLIASTIHLNMTGFLPSAAFPSFDFF